MGRPAQFSRRAVVEQAMALFWRQGYEATSIDELTSATGLSRSSLYQAFGNKRGLFDAAIAHYGQTMVTAMLADLEAEGAGAGAIRTFFDRLAGLAAAEPEQFALGCLLTNAITELATSEPSFASTTDRYISRLTTAFGNALRRSATEVGLPTERVEARAQLLATVVLGSWVRARGEHNTATHRQLAEVVDEMLVSWGLPAPHAARAPRTTRPRQTKRT